jgi:hypothetical protein
MGDRNYLSRAHMVDDFALEFFLDKGGCGSLIRTRPEL